MADILLPRVPGFVGTDPIVKRYKDMGDGTHAEVVFSSGAAGGGSGTTLPAGTDRSGAITVGGTAQTLAAANTARTGLTGQNISSGDLWINEIGGTAAADTAGSYKIPAGGTFEVSTNRAVSIVGATTGQKFTATEY